MADYRLPDVGEGLTEAEIVSWKVRPGDVVEVNDIVVEIETAKSLVELPSPYAGTVQALHVPEGETVPVGTAIISIGDAAPAGPPIDLSNPAATGGGENQTLVGYGPRAASGRRRRRRGAAQAATAAGAAAQQQLHGAFGAGDVGEVPATDQDAAAGGPAVLSAAAVGRSGPVDRAVGRAGARALAKPPVRKLAGDLGVDLESVTPSGPGGTVTRADVQRAAGTQPAQPSQPARPTEAGSAGAGERRQQVKGVRKAMAQAMVQSAFSAPHVTVWVTVDVTRTTRLVARLQRQPAFREVRVSPLLVAAKAVCLAVRRTPEVNATWDEQAQEVVLKSYVNLGIAAATARGLVVPVVRGAESMTLPELGTAINELTRSAREGRTQPAQLSGGSITITNVGVFGVDAGTPILNPGESAILCVGAVRQRPWVHKGRIKVRDAATLALSFDHRLVDGEQGSRFLTDVAAVLEDPGRALLL